MFYVTSPAAAGRVLCQNLLIITHQILYHVMFIAEMRDFLGVYFGHDVLYLVNGYCSLSNSK